MYDEKLLEIISILNDIKEDPVTPKNIKLKIDNAVLVLSEEGSDVSVKVNKSIQELDEVSEDQNVPSYIRTQIWRIVSDLELL